ncbi:ThuA domain-containing protein [Aestuariimicrobium sp. T2.26MG-19.2B]|uniref:ThuA domain-containing protein n=1 Tax=Aestuariimicrobium sp. T2.26MG-19.2B TaxID=3040679 RepID=UPI0024778A0E|nr:ThuA domain-containing protein [Aestuariimicrobium sp. T2.26MG-19.2B]CAI9407674.1 hypothetical protein AESSP_01872 [Aestuariimicrobium sp. T2.26MG-19.2B]
MADLLLVTATHEAFRHSAAIEAGVALFARLAAEAGLDLLHTEDTSVLNPDDLARARAVVFHQCNGEILTDDQRACLQSAVRAGCGFAAVHNSTGAERGWPGYLELVGARFRGHPPLNDQRRGLRAVAPDPSTQHLPDPWSWSDEWYEFESEPVGVEPLVVLADEPDRPLSWRGRLGLGRTWYTALGHRAEAYSDRVFVDHVWGGITGVMR